MSELVPYADQRAAVEREIKLRESVYPRRVDAGKMSQALADRELLRMRAVLRTLELVDAINRDLLEAGETRDDFSLAVSLCRENGVGVESLEDSIVHSLDDLFQPAPAGQRSLL